MKLKSDVKHNGKLYKTGSKIEDKELVKVFSKVDLLEKEEKKVQKKDNK